MFWFAMYMLVFGSSSAPGGVNLPDAKKFQKAIKDQPRLEKVLDLRREAAEIDKGRKQAVESSTEKLSKLSLRHDATLDELNAVFSELDEARRIAREGLLDIRFQWKDTMTRKEWKKIYGKP